MVVLDVEYNGTVIALSTGIAFIGAFAAVSLCEQYRLSTTKGSKRDPLILMAFVALALGGVGIWCMHFISISSFRLKNDGVDIPVRYNISMLIVSLFAVCILEFAGLYCASTDSCFNKSKKEIMEKFIAQASDKYSLSEIKHLSKFKILTIVSTHSLERIILGGFIAGGGVVVMHYLGMMSMEFQGTVRYNPGLVALSVIISVLAVIGGFWIFFRVLSLFPSLDILRVACALNGMFSLSGVHYIGLVSATYDYDASKAAVNTSNSIDAQHTLVGVLAAAVIFCAIIQVYVMADLRDWLLRTSTQLRQADNVVQSLGKQQGSGAHQCSSPRSSPLCAATDRRIAKYLTKYGKHAAESTGAAGVTSTALYNDYSDDEEAAEHSKSLSTSAGPRRAARHHEQLYHEHHPGTHHSSEGQSGEYSGGERTAPSFNLTVRSKPSVCATSPRTSTSEHFRVFPTLSGDAGAAGLLSTKSTPTISASASAGDVTQFDATLLSIEGLPAQEYV